MVMPPHFDPGPDEGAPLERNVFELRGYSLEYAGYRVFEVATGEECARRVEVESAEEIAPRWKERGPPYPPGAVQLRSLVRVWFSPAKPGGEYRLQSMAGEVVRRYEGPPVDPDPSMERGGDEGA